MRPPWRTRRSMPDRAGPGALGGRPEETGMPRPLKVFRTPVGFYDAVVAAPSQKAALAAWGTTTNLFASGDACAVGDPALQSEALAHPGEVIKKPRGDVAAMLGPKPLRRPARQQARR